MSKKIVILLAVLVFVLAGVGGWFVRSSMVKKDYDEAWSGYEKEVKAWVDVNERYQVLGPVCGELAGEADCSELKSAGEEATKTAENLSLDLKKAKSASKEETQKLEKATKDIKAEREKFEPAVEKVEKAAEATIQDKFAPVLEEAEKKAREASELVGSLAGKVKDDKVLEQVKKAASELSSACGKWKGKDIPTGQKGVQAYLELKRLTLTCSDAVTKANESHKVWQAEQKPKGAYPGAGGPRPANAQPWPTGTGGNNAYSYSHEVMVETGETYCSYMRLNDKYAIGCTNGWAGFHDVYPVRPFGADPGSGPASAILLQRNGLIDYDNPSGEYGGGEWIRSMPVDSAWYADSYVLGRTAEGVTAWDTNSGHGFFISNDGKRTETF